MLVEGAWVAGWFRLAAPTLMMPVLRAQNPVPNVSPTVMSMAQSVKRIVPLAGSQLWFGWSDWFEDSIVEVWILVVMISILF